jgi:hypothetical protein
MRGFVGASYELLSFLICMVPAVLGVCFAFRPCERLLALMRPLTLGAVFAALCSFALAIANGSAAKPATCSGRFPKQWTPMY